MAKGASATLKEHFVATDYLDLKRGIDDAVVTPALVALPLGIVSPEFDESV